MNDVKLERTDRILLRALNVAECLFAFTAPAIGTLYAAAGDWTALALAVPGVLACAFITWAVPEALHRIANEQHNAREQRATGARNLEP